MKKILFSFFISVACAGHINAQSIQITEEPATASNGVNDFQLAAESVTMNGNVPAFIPAAVSADVNTATGLAAAASLSGIQVFDVNGDALSKSKQEISASDNSIKVYAGADGAFVLRENIANFLFFNTFGNVENSVSNSSKSSEGESVSKYAADPFHQTKVLYNPKIITDGREGSRARVVKPNGTTTNIYYSNERSIKYVKVSENAQFVGLVTAAPGTDDQLHLVDRFGIALNTFSFNQPIVGFRLAEDASVVTVRSNSRVAVYSVLEGERLGSTSFRSEVQFAEYIPKDETILAVTGNRTGSRLSDIEFHAINIARRAIERQDYGGTLGVSSSIPLEIERTGKFSYELSGLSKTLNVTVGF